MGKIILILLSTIVIAISVTMIYDARMIAQKMLMILQLVKIRQMTLGTQVQMLVKLKC